MASVHTTCPYCGVGCGVVADGKIVGDPAHPSNRGRLCSKGAALGETLDDRSRLLTPTMDGRAVSWDDALDRIATRFRETIAQHGPDSVAFYGSGQLLTEDYYVANKLMKGFIGSGNMDTNSRLCMASSVAGHVRAFGEDLVPGVYEDWEEADLVVLVGSNAAWCHPVLYQRLLAAKAARGTRIVVLDPRRTATAEAADLHLPLASGSDVALFNGLLVHLADAGRIDDAWVARHAVGLDAALLAARADAPDIAATAVACGIDPEALETFYEWFARTERVMTVWSQGVNQSDTGTDKTNAIINCHLATGRIGRPGMGPFSVTGQPNAMGGREVGGLANQLAAHLRLESVEDRATLSRFWRRASVAERPGFKAVELFDAVLDGRVKAIWIAATNPADTMPRADRARAALEACPFVVVADCWATDTSRYADVVLPAAGWGEKDGTVTNSERRISRQRPFRVSPGEAKPDWWMFAEVGRRMGWADDFAWGNSAAVFREHAALSGFENGGKRAFDISALANLDDAGYNALRPVRWPLPEGASGEGGRLFAAGGFSTPDRRARLVAVRGVAAAQPAPFLLNTGRMRDQWHTMTRTGQVPRLMTHAAEPLLTIHPADAAGIGLQQGELARVETDEGAVLLRADLRHAQRRGDIFAPMHWTDAFTSAGPVAQTVWAKIDPHSGQPALKSTPARVTPVAEQFHGLLLRRSLGQPPASCHWVRLPIEEGQLYRLSGLVVMPTGDVLQRFARDLVGDLGGLEWLEVFDPGRQVLRAAVLRDGCLEAALFLAADRSRLPSAEPIAALLGQKVPDARRAALLAGRAGGDTAEEGPRICACFGVTRAAIRHAIVTHGLRDVAAIGRHLRAGTNCGSCIPELEEILREIRVPVS